VIIESSAGSSTTQRAELLTCSIYSILDVRAECIYSGSLGEKGVHRVSFPMTGGERKREKDRERERERERERDERDRERRRGAEEGKGGRQRKAYQKRRW
jgi:hypothetical protein